MISFSDLSISFLARYMMAIEANAIIDISINDIFQFDTIVSFESKFSDDFVCCDKSIFSDDEVAVHFKYKKFLAVVFPF